MMLIFSLDHVHNEQAKEVLEGKPLGRYRRTSWTRVVGDSCRSFGLSRFDGYYTMDEGSGQNSMGSYHEHISVILCRVHY